MIVEGDWGLSGPKTDELTLRQMEAERLEKRRQERLRQMKLATAKFHQSIENAKNLSDKIHDYLQDVVLELKNYPDVSNTLNEFNEIKNEYVDSIVALAAESPRGEIRDIIAKGKSILSQSEKLKTEFFNKTKAHCRILTSYLKGEADYKEKTKFVQLLKTTKRKSLEFQDIKENSKSNSGQISKDFNEYMEHLVELINNFVHMDYLFTDSKAKALSIYNQIINLKESNKNQDQKTTEIKRMERNFNILRELISIDIEETKDLYNEYVSECILASVEPKGIRGFSSKNQLKNEIYEMRKSANKKTVRIYIQEQIDEVMAKHNCNIIKSDILEPVKKGNRKLYGIDDDTAINVFLSEDNETTMAVVAVGFDESLGKKENEALYQEQWNFCKLYSNIVADLEARGIIFNTKEHRPPDKKYNRKVKIRERENGSQKGIKRDHGDSTRERALEL